MIKSFASAGQSSWCGLAGARGCAAVAGLAEVAALRADVSALPPRALCVEVAVPLDGLDDVVPASHGRSVNRTPEQVSMPVAAEFASHLRFGAGRFVIRSRIEKHYVSMMQNAKFI